MKDSKKERRIRWGAAIFFIAFFLVAYKCSGQIDRVKRYNNSEITTLIPHSPMKFNDGRNDTIYVSIMADSLAGGYDCRLFCFMPKDRQISDYSINIGLADGSIESLAPTTVIKQYNYAEYDLDSLSVTNLNNPFAYIAFENSGLEERCISLKTPDFFVKFFGSLK